MELTRVAPRTHDMKQEAHRAVEWSDWLVVVGCLVSSAGIR